MTDEMTSTAPAGWYAHPSMADTQRYWDGQQWTDYVAPGLPTHLQQAAAQAEEERSNGSLTAVAVILMVVFPIGGFIAGCILLGKRAVTAGAVIMVLSVVSGYIWYALYEDHQQSQCISDNLDRISQGLPTLDCG